MSTSIQRKMHGQTRQPTGESLPFKLAEAESQPLELPMAGSQPLEHAGTASEEDLSPPTLAEAASEKDRSPLIPARGILAVAIALGVRLLTGSLRIRWYGDQHQLEATQQGPCIYAFRHGELLPLAALYAAPSRVVLVSLSRDGALMARVITLLGFRVVRGSSTRGGEEGIRKLEAVLRDGFSVALAVDGPKGPPGVPKAGAFRLSQRTGVPVVPLRARGKGWRLNSWDRFFIPWPFSVLRVLRGKPRVFDPRDRWSQAKAALEASLHAAGQVGPHTPIVGMVRRTHPSPSGSPPEIPRRGGLISGDHPPPVPTLLSRCYAPLLAGLELPILLILGLVALLRPKWRLGWRQRLGGLAPASTQAAATNPWAGPEPDSAPASTQAAARPCWWLQAASVGEVGIAATLIQAMQARFEGPFQVHCTSRHGLEPNTPIPIRRSLAPLDLPLCLRRRFNLMAPKGIILIETELWPLLLLEARRRQIPVFLVNASLSQRSFTRLLRARGLFGPLLSTLWVFARTDMDAQRFRALGVPASRCKVSGDLKTHPFQGTRPRASIPGLEAWARRGPTLIAASVHGEEIGLVLEAFAVLRSRHPALRLILAPRYPAEVEDGMGAAIGWVRRTTLSQAATSAVRAAISLDRTATSEDRAVTSENRAGTPRDRAVTSENRAGTPRDRAVTSENRAGTPRDRADTPQDHAGTPQDKHLNQTQVLFLDTLGELKALYGLAQLVIAGGTFAPVGGHNLHEIAAAGVGILAGPHLEAVADQAQRLSDAGALVCLEAPAQLVDRLDVLLSTPSQLEIMGQAARSIAEEASPGKPMAITLAGIQAGLVRGTCRG